MVLATDPFDVGLVYGLTDPQSVRPVNPHTTSADVTDLGHAAFCATLRAARRGHE